MNAEYNPRRISDHARKKLKKLLEKHGLVNAPVWNKRTGRLVGGHQRVSILDDLEGSSDYLLDVNAVDVDERKERQLNIALNNQEAAGEWDADRLADMLKADDKIDYDAIGFDGMDLQILVDDPELSKLFARDAQSKEAKGALVDAESAAAAKAAGKKKQTMHDAIKEKLDRERGADFYAVVVFADGAAQAAFMTALGYSSDDIYADGRRVAEKMGLKLT